MAVKFKLADEEKEKANKILKVMEEKESVADREVARQQERERVNKLFNDIEEIENKNRVRDNLITQRASALPTAKTRLLQTRMNDNSNSIEERRINALARQQADAFNTNNQKTESLPVANQNGVGDKTSWIARRFANGVQGSVLDTLGSIPQSMAVGYDRGAKQASQEQSKEDKVKNAIKNIIKTNARDPLSKLLYTATLGREDAKNQTLNAAAQIVNNYNQAENGWGKVGAVLGGLSSFVLQETNPVAQELYNSSQMSGQLMGEEKSKEARDKLLEFDENIHKDNDQWNKELAKEGEKYGEVANFIGDTANTIGYMTPSIALSYISGGAGLGESAAHAIGLAQMGLASKGQSTREGLSQGLDLETADRKGISSATAETGSELMFDGLKVFKKFKSTGVEAAARKWIEDSVEKKIKSSLGKKLTKSVGNWLLDVSGESIEEITTDIYNTWLDNATNDPNKQYTLEDATNTVLRTVASTTGINVGTSAVNRASNTILNRNSTNTETQEQPEIPNTALEQQLINQQNNVPQNPTSQEIDIAPVVNEQNRYENRGNTNELLEQLPAVNQENTYTNKLIESLRNNVTENDNLTTSAQKHNLKFDDISIESIQQVMDKADIKSRFDIADKFMNEDGTINENIGSYWSLTKNSDGTYTREIIFNPKASEKTIIQEMAVHEMFHDIFAKNTRISNDLYKSVKEYLEKDTEYINQKENLRNQYEGVYGDEVDQFITEEAIAKTLQTKFGTQEEINRLVNYNPSAARRFYDWIIDKLNKITGGNIERLYWEDVRNKFERAYSQEGNYKDSTFDNNNLTQYHISQNLSSDLDNVLKNLTAKEPVRLRDFTPSTFVQNGVQDLPMYENPSHIRKNILTEAEAMKLGLAINPRDHYHGLGKELYMKAIDSLDNPRVIFKRTQQNQNGNSEYFVLTMIKDNNNNNIVIPVEIETNTKIGKNIIDINRVETVYGYEKKNGIDLNDYIKHNLSNNKFEKIYEQKEDQGTGFSTATRSSINSIPSSNENVNTTKYSIQESENNSGSLKLPKVKEGYTRLYRGLESEYNPQYDKNKLDNVNGYESWTDNYDLAKSYGDNVYYIDVPTSEIKNSVIDEDSNSETYGDRNLIYKNDKPVGINGQSGNEYMLYTEHDNYKNLKYNNVNNTNSSTDNNGRKLSKGLQEFFNNSQAKVDSNGKISENGKLATVYHTMTDRGAQFNEFNPVGTPYYRFGDQVVNYFTDSKDMSGSYADGDYKKADTKKITNMEDFENQVNEINKNINDFYEIKINKNSDNTYTAKIEYSKGQGKMFTIIETELEKLKNSEPSVFNELRNRAMTIKNPYEMFTSNNESDSDKYNVNPEVNKKTDEFIYKIFNNENTPMTYTAGETARLIQQYLTSKKIGNINFTSKEDLFRNFRERLSKEYPRIGGTNKYQYEGYVNIENPYIIDAEKRNWNQVVSESNNFIDELTETVSQDTINNLSRLYKESQEISANARAEYTKLNEASYEIDNFDSWYYDTTSDDVKALNKIIRDTSIEEVLTATEDNNSSALRTDFWYNIADDLKENEIIGETTAELIREDYKLPQQIKEWINANINKPIQTTKYNGTLRDLYESKDEAYETFNKYRYEDSYFKEKIMADESEKGYVDLGELNDLLEQRAEIMGADTVADEIAQASSVSFSKPELIRLWGTSKTTNDVVKEIIASNKDGKTNYDGIIIKNVYDYGGRSESKEPANLYVTFNSNQFKAVDNTNPTSDPDIRYSNNANFDDYIKERIGKVKGTKTSLADLRAPKADEVSVAETPRKGKEVNTAPTADNNVAERARPERSINYDVQSEQNTIIDELPISDDRQKFRKHYDSIMKSQYTTDEARAIAKQLMKSDTYIPESNNKQLERADTRIKMSGADSELNSLMSRSMTGGNIKADDIAVGERLIQYYSKMGNKAKLQEAIQATAMAGTTAGQTVQAMSLLNHQTPEGQAVWLQRSVEKMNNDLKQRRGPNADQFDLTPEMTEKIVNSKNAEELQNNLNEVYEELGQQVSKSTIEKIDAWRYFSMLANPRTHIRNIVGNVAMGKVQTVKNKVAGVIEGTVGKFNPDMERTHTIAPASKAVKQFAQNDIANVADRLELNDNKYNPKTRLENSMRTFKHDAFENTLGKLFEFNNKALEVEDAWGLKAAYKKSLAEYMTANKLNPDTITDKQLAKARNYAVEQAKEATFHQASALATALNQFSNKNGVTKFISDSVVPFKKTPINVAKAGMEYSPVGLAKSAIYDTVQLRKGNISVNQYIDNVSKGLTGTGVALLGYALAEAGILKASGTDDKDKESYDQDRGKQTYSIQIGDNTYSLDWLAPTGIPLFIGAEVHEIMQQEKESKTSSSDEDSVYNQALNSAMNIVNSLTNAVDPMTEMSMLSGLTSTLKSYDNNLFSGMAINMGKSYVNQFVPTALGQIAKTTDEYQRSTTSTKKGTLPKAIDSTKNQIMAKIPGLRQMLPTKTDIWGNEQKQSENILQRGLENAVFPWTRKGISTNNVDRELETLYKDTGESSVLPDSINRDLTIDKQKYVMTSEEYARYKKQYGEDSYKILNNLVSSSQYKKMNDSQKQKAIEKVYEYAKEQIKIDYAKNNKLTYDENNLSKTVNSLKKANANVSNYFEYIASTQDTTKTSEKLEKLTNSNYSKKTKQIIYENSLLEADDEKYPIIKNTGLDIDSYLKYKIAASNGEFAADIKNSNIEKARNNTVTGSGSKKAYNYIMNMQGATYMQKIILYGLSYSPKETDKQAIANYIVNMEGKTYEERKEMLKKFSWITIYNDGSYDI